MESDQITLFQSEILPEMIYNYYKIPADLKKAELHGVLLIIKNLQAIPLNVFAVIIIKIILNIQYVVIQENQKIVRQHLITLKLLNG
ncbi:unnamed protein product [Paramecium octaurelia]|uniref:Uncharacterized protein n=1 Tax=Paramecium octaurelia TaxID=43137 RepID=A0A8S1WSQ1_PAROT|nr:unnamed protein product [Paramecium octaurelia]